ncbi:hypothetical protein N7522_001493 [Penicillium canescens]|nr:hypothetical protein N7522_001493 [Penicillium canescens]
MMRPQTFMQVIVSWRDICQEYAPITGLDHKPNVQLSMKMATNVQNDSNERKAIAHEFSFPSSSTTYSLTERSKEPKTVDQNGDGLQTEQKCRRPEELENMLRERDEISTSRFCKFGLIQDQYAKLKGLPVFLAHHEKYLPNSKHWGLGLSRILGEGPAAVATKLSEGAVTNSQAFLSKTLFFLWKHDLLSVMLYSDLLKAPKHCDILLQLKTDLEEIQSDPFVLVTIEHTWQNLLIQQRRQPRAFLPPEVMKGLSQKLNKSLDRVIINPLQQLLKRPATARHILEELEVLKHRFCDYYKTSDVDWNLAFDTNIWFLDHIRCEQQISTLAEAITKEDHALFSGYITLAFSKNENQPREQRQAQSLLNRRWNDFSNGVKYCMAAGIYVALQVDLLAEAFYRRRNYYSLTAIAQGVNVSGLAIDTLRKFGNLVNPEGCYTHYRQHISVRTRALHFLSPAIFYWARGDQMGAECCIGICVLYFNRATSGP